MLKHCDICYTARRQAYMYNDDDFNWNHGLSLASTGNYKAAEVNIS
jgi:hypothetical protein